jgi:hypothetical protein
VKGEKPTSSTTDGTLMTALIKEVAKEDHSDFAASRAPSSH